jgi:acetyl esterase/lipase
MLAHVLAAGAAGFYPSALQPTTTAGELSEGISLHKVYYPPPPPSPPKPPPPGFPPPAYPPGAFLVYPRDLDLDELPGAEEIMDDDDKDMDRNDCSKSQFGNCVPFMEPFYAPHPPPNGSTAVIILPGGGNTGLNFREGWPIAQRFQQLNITAFVLHYRVPNWPQPQRGKFPNGTWDGTVEMGPGWKGLADGARALALVRARAAECRVNPEKIGVLGFSAGGGIAALLSNAWQPDQRISFTHVDSVDWQPIRPSFVALMYPALCVPNNGTAGAVGSCLGCCSLISPRGDLWIKVRANHPPTFIGHARDDATVPINGSIMLAALIDKAPFTASTDQLHAPTEVHLYKSGEHAFATRDCFGPGASGKYSGKHRDDWCRWFDQMVWWMSGLGYQ